MTRHLYPLWRDTRGAAAAEMVLVLPLLTVLLFGGFELGNYFRQEHQVVSQVRDGARFASRLPLAADYDCDGNVFEDPDAETKIVNVTRTGRVDGSGEAPFPADIAACGSATASVIVENRCVDQAAYGGIYTGLDGDIPVVKVTAQMQYQSLFGTLGFTSSGLCLRATSEVPVAGL